MRLSQPFDNAIQAKQLPFLFFYNNLVNRKITQFEFFQI